MEREQIIKALELCISSRLRCKECPYFIGDGDIRCKRAKFLKDIRSLIRELIEENERLQKANDVLLLMPSVADVKADTVRKMAERIERRCIEGGIYPVLVKNAIAQVAKELLDGYAEPFGIMDGIKKRMEQDTCVACGEAVPEGRQICHSCEVREND